MEVCTFYNEPRLVAHSTVTANEKANEVVTCPTMAHAIVTEWVADIQNFHHGTEYIEYGRI